MIEHGFILSTARMIGQTAYPCQHSFNYPVRNKKVRLSRIVVPDHHELGNGMFR